MRPAFDAPSASVRARWLAVVLLAGAILVVSVIPIPGSVPQEGVVPTSVLFHFSGYAALAAALAIALLSRRLHAAVGGAFLGASAYGVLVELAQLGLAYRSFSYRDMAINGSGALFAVVLVLVVVPLARRRSE